jgi:hypothetical protein
VSRRTTQQLDNEPPRCIGATDFDNCGATPVGG